MTNVTIFNIGDIHCNLKILKTDSVPPLGAWKLRESERPVSKRKTKGRKGEKSDIPFASYHISIALKTLNSS